MKDTPMQIKPHLIIKSTNLHEIGSGLCGMLNFNTLNTKPDEMPKFSDENNSCANKHNNLKRPSTRCIKYTF